MSNPFLLPSGARLTDWKRFRAALPPLPEAEQLRQVSSYWAQAPLGPIPFGLAEPEHWPTTWEMIGAGHWSGASVAIGMEATLRLAGWDCSRLLLSLRAPSSKQSMLLFIDRERVLNYDLNTVSHGPDFNHEDCINIKWTGRSYSVL